MQIDERKKKVLQALIIDYISSAEPVGSRTISRKFDLGVSSATIRNEMADLEEMGYIEQPHTSAGRIPSDRGYRFYVDSLMERTSLTGSERSVVEGIVFQKMKKIQGLVQETSRLLSELTKLTSIVAFPSQSLSKFSQIHLLPYQPGKALMVVIRDNGSVENNIIDVPESTSLEDLQKVTSTLNSKLKGTTLTEVKTRLLREICSELSHHKELLTTALDVLEPIIDQEETDGLVLGGTLNMLNQPEFKDVEKLRTVLKVFEEGQSIKKVLTEESGTRLSVRIGGENKLEEMHNCSLITASYELDGQTLGVIGVLGPTRMNYAKACSLVEYMTANLTEAINRFYHR